MIIRFTYTYDLDMYMSEGFRSMSMSGQGTLDIDTDTLPMGNNEKFLTIEQIEDYLKYDILESFTELPDVDHLEFNSKDICNLYKEYISN